FRLVSSPVGRSLRRRGINARVLRPGTIRIGDPVRIGNASGGGRGGLVAAPAPPPEVRPRRRV
ncbi:MAG: MOSC domain-containing protein, partial [Actinomycetota bacterium]|nr:MOSC domain-containing protein [Actinomycetota bacterium]